MISWRTARIFLLYLTSMAMFLVMVAGVGDVRLSALVASFNRPEVQPTQPSAGLPTGQAGKAAPLPVVYPVLVIPKDAPSIFDEV